MQDILNYIGKGIISLSIAVAGLFGFGGTPAEAPSENVGATIPVSVAVFQTSLQSSISSSATSMTLVAGTDKSGDNLSGYICFNIDEGTATEEFVCGTASGTSVSSMIRGIDPVDGDLEVSALKKAHRRGASVKVTNYPSLAILSRIMNGDETFPNKISYTSHPTFSSNTEIIDKKYADDLAIAGAPDASTTVKGLVEEATASEINAGTAAGGTSARLFVNPSALASSNYASYLPSSDQKNALAGTSGTPSSTNKYVTADDVSATSSASKIPRFNGSGFLDIASMLTISSQAQGDILYASSASVWARLGAGTSGKFLKTQGAAANPTWADAVIYKNGTTTYDLATASGVQNIAHSLGQIPKKVRITIASPAGVLDTFIVAVYNGTTSSVVGRTGTSGSYVNPNSSGNVKVSDQSDAGSYQVGVITFDATNIIITWTKTGAPDDVINILWEAES